MPGYGDWELQLLTLRKDKAVRAEREGETFFRGGDSQQVIEPLSAVVVAIRDFNPVGLSPSCGEFCFTVQPVICVVSLAYCFRVRPFY